MGVPGCPRPLCTATLPLHLDPPKQEEKACDAVLPSITTAMTILRRQHPQVRLSVVAANTLRYWQAEQIATLADAPDVVWLMPSTDGPSLPPNFKYERIRRTHIYRTPAPPSLGVLAIQTDGLQVLNPLTSSVPFSPLPPSDRFLLPLFHSLPHVEMPRYCGGVSVGALTVWPCVCGRAAGGGTHASERDHGVG